LLTWVVQRGKVVGFKRDTLWKIFILFPLEILTLFGFLVKTEHFQGLLFMYLTTNEMINGGKKMADKKELMQHVSEDVKHVHSDIEHVQRDAEEISAHLKNLDEHMHNLMEHMEELQKESE